MTASFSCAMVNGVLAQQLDVRDRGLQYGDGLFETILVENDQCLLWDSHLQRLEKGCLALGIVPPSEGLLKQEARQLLDACKPGPAILKIIVTRGAGGRGYRVQSINMPTRLLSLAPLPQYPDNILEQGIRARFCDLRLSRQPRLAGIKHLNRLEQVMARQEWGDEFEEGILLDDRGQVVEGVMSNIFILSQGRLVTPALDDCGVAGVVREQVLQQHKALGIPVVIAKVTPEDLLGAEAVFFSNSVIGIWQLRTLDAHLWNPHPLVHKLRQIAGFSNV